MYKKRKKRIYVIGHKNPDTDSICSAIAYANLKNCINKEKGKEYVAKRAGQVNEETLFVLDYFKENAPGYVSDIRPQVKNIEIRESQGIDENLSLKKAWDLMRDSRIFTLPILKKNKLEGVITVGDIAYSDMNVYDSTNVSAANTSYKNILETLDGEMIVGNPDDYFNKGKIIIATANPDLMENYIEENDMVLLGNRYESQLCAIEMGAGCIVVGMGAPVSLTIRKLAKERGCKIIATPYDTFVIAKLIGHSMPVRHFMTKEGLVTFSTEDFIDDIQNTMAKKRFRDFPVVDNKERFVGMISRRNLLQLERKQLILVDHNEKTQAVDGFEEAEILEIIDHHRLGNIETLGPIFFRNQPVGCTATIITQMYQENGVKIEPKIAGLLCSAILSDTLMFRSPTCTEIDKQVAKYLAKIAGIEIEEYAKKMFTAGSNLKEKSPEEIFYQDFKKFTGYEKNFGVGQINSMSSDELRDIKDKLLPYMKKNREHFGLDMLFFMLTDILQESTELIIVGDDDVDPIIETSFHVKPENNSAYLRGVVSRKKQLIPSLLTGIQTFMNS